MSEYLVKGFDAPKQSASGNNYCFITISGIDTGNAETFKALYFFKGDFDLGIGEKYELDIKDGKEPGQKIANKPKKKGFGGGGYSKNPTFNELKRLKSIELAVQLVIANKIEMKDLEKINKRLNELI
jgi:hypothetical protein